MNICMLYHGFLSSLEKDSRVLKEIKSLAEEGHSVTVLTVDPSLEKKMMKAFDIEFICKGLLARAEDGHKYKKRTIFQQRARPILETTRRLSNLLDSIGIWNKLYYAQMLGRLAYNEDADVYHVHDYEPLLAAVLVGRVLKVPVVYDAHEYLLGRRDVVRYPKWRQQFTKFLEGVLVRQTARVITVNDSIASLISEDYEVEPPLVIRNVPHFEDVEQSDVLRDLTGIPADKKIVLYQGGLMSNRGLEQLMETSLLLDDAVIVALGDGPMKEELRQFSEGSGEGRFYVLNAVPPTELLEYTASADVGVSPMQNIGMNNYLTSGNKLGEYIMAGIPIAVSDFPEMRKLAVDEDLGVVFDPENPEDMARAIRKLLEPETYTRKRKNVLEARKRHNWENEEKKLVEMYGMLKEKKITGVR